MYIIPLATAGPPSVSVLLPKSAVNRVCRPPTLPGVKVFSAGLVLRWRGDWPYCGHSLGAPAALAGATAAARPNGAVRAAIPARMASRDVSRMRSPTPCPSDKPARYPLSRAARRRQRDGKAAMRSGLLPEELPRSAPGLAEAEHQACGGH